MIRYADDFVVTCRSEKEAGRIKEEIAEMLEEKIGLKLSDDKTNITNIHDGFNFLWLSELKNLLSGSTSGNTGRKAPSTSTT